MRITENFIDPLDYQGNRLNQFTVALVANDDGEPYIEIEAAPRVRAADLGVLIGMLEVLKRRAVKP